MIGVLASLAGGSGWPILANLLDNNNPGWHLLKKTFRPTHRSSPLALVVMVSLAAMAATAYAVWTWQQGKNDHVSAQALLKQGADSLGLSKAHRKLLWLLGRWAAQEPVVALISPSLLVGMVERAEKAGLPISAGRARLVSQILDAVSAACPQQIAART